MHVPINQQQEDGCLTWALFFNSHRICLYFDFYLAVFCSLDNYSHLREKSWKIPRTKISIFIPVSTKRNSAPTSFRATFMANSQNFSFQISPIQIVVAGILGEYNILDVVFCDVCFVGL